MIAIPINGLNIQTLAANVGIFPTELAEQMHQAKVDYKKKVDMEYILSFFNANEEWYNRTLKKVKEIEQTLQKGIDHKEKTIKMYAWIKDDTEISGNLSIPMQMDKEYSEASVIKMVLKGDIDTYEKILRWD